MKWAFLIAGVTQAIASVFNYLYPDVLFGTNQIEAVKLYALALLSIALINLLCWKYFDLSQNIRFIYMTMMFFQLAISFTLHGFNPESIPLKFEATLFHLVIFIIYFLAYMKDIKSE
jgi:hypothetical protein